MPRISHVRHIADAAADDAASISPTKLVADQLGLGELAAQHGPQLQAAGVIASFIGGLLRKRTYVDSTGKTREMPAGRGYTDIVSSWMAMMDNTYFSGLNDQLKAEQRAKENQLLAGYYRARGYSEETIKHYSSRPSLERLAVKAAMIYQGHDKALRHLNLRLKDAGVGASSAGPRQQAAVNLAAQMYRAATDVSPYTPWQGGKADERLGVMLEMQASGAFNDLYRKRGVFEKEGTFTPYGYALASERIKEAGRTMNLARSLTGKQSVYEAYTDLKGIFGDNVSQQLTDPETGRLLGAYNSLARSAGLAKPEQRLQMLRAMQSVTGSKSLKHNILASMPKLSFDQISNTDLLYGNRTADEINLPMWNNLTMRAALAARQGPTMMVTRSVAAALEGKFGRTAAYNIMDSVLDRGLRYKNGIVKEASKYLGGGLTWKRLQELSTAPEAVAYMESGRAMPALITAEAAKYWNRVRSSSPWLAKHATRIFQETGGIGVSNIQTYLANHSVAPHIKGRIMAHVDSLKYKLGGDVNTYLHVVGAGARMRQRAASMRQAYAQGTTAYNTAHMQQSTGVEGITRASQLPDNASVMGVLSGAFGGAPNKQDPSGLLGEIGTQPNELPPVNVGAPRSNDPAPASAPAPVPAPVPDTAGDGAQAYSPTKPPEFRPPDPLDEPNKEQMA